MLVSRVRSIGFETVENTSAAIPRGAIAFFILLAGATLALLHPEAIHIYRGWWHSIVPGGYDSGGYFAHSTCYAVLAAVGVWLLPRNWHALFLAALLMHGVSTELAQILIPGRTFDLKDMACNCTSATVAFLVASACQSLIRSRKTSNATPAIG